MLDDTVSLRAGRLSIGWEYGLDYDFFTQCLERSVPHECGRSGTELAQLQPDSLCELGHWLKWQPNDNWQFKASFMNGYPQDFADPKYGRFQLDFQPGKGSFWIGEVTYRWQATDAERSASGRLPGQFKLGGYADTGQFDYVDGSPRKETGLGDLYMILRQKVWEPEPLSHRGMHVWTAFSYAWNDEIVTFPYYWNGGVVWQGPLVSTTCGCSAAVVRSDSIITFRSYRLRTLLNNLRPVCVHRSMRKMEEGHRQKDHMRQPDVAKATPIATTLITGTGQNAATVGCEQPQVRCVATRPAPCDWHTTTCRPECIHRRHVQRHRSQWSAAHSCTCQSISS